MQIVKRSMNWFTKPSAYNYLKSQQEKRKEAHQSFLDSQSSLADGVTGILSSARESAATNAAKAALTRVTSSGSSSADQIQQAIDQLKVTSDSINGTGDGSAASSDDTTTDILA